MPIAGSILNCRLLELEAEIDSLPIVPVPRNGATIDGLTLGTILSDGRYSRVFGAVRVADGLDVVAKFPKPVAAPNRRSASPSSGSSGSPPASAVHGSAR